MSPAVLGKSSIALGQLNADNDYEVCTTIVELLLWRSMPSACFELGLSNALINSDALPTGDPSIERMISPASNPALLAGEAGSTSDIIAPWSSTAPMRAAEVGDRS